MEITIPIISHTFYDLSKFDFSFKDIYLLDITGEEFKNYIISFQSDYEYENYYSSVDHIIKELPHDKQKCYAIIKKDAKSNFNYGEIKNVWKLLLIIFPSKLQILHELYYWESDGIFQSGGFSSWHENIGDNDVTYLYSKDDYLSEINEFIKLAFERLKQRNYIDLAIYHYLSSFESSQLHYNFLSLCMVLESVISEPIELTYRLRRTIAILIGETDVNCNLIYKNISLVYKLRSQIIHGDEYDYKKIKDYYPFLLAIASRTIIELLLHNFSKKPDLNHRITELGFGDRSKISLNYKYYLLNLLTETTSNCSELEK